MSRQFLYVGDFLGATVSIVDLAAGRVDRTLSMGTVPVQGVQVGVQVDSFAVSPDRSTIYASRFPHDPQLDRMPGVRAVPGDLVALDTRSDEILWTLPTEGKPNHISISRDGDEVYVPVRDRAHIDIVDVASRTVAAKVNCGWGPHGTRLSRDGRLLYVGTMFGQTLDVLDLASRTPAVSLHLGQAVRPFAVAADDTVAYAQLSRLHGFVVVDLVSQRITQTVYLPDLGLPTVPETVNHGMGLTRDGGQLWVAATAADYVAVFEVPSLALIQTIPVGGEPAYIELDSTDQRCFVSNRAEDTVSVLDMASRTELTRISVGRSPNRMKYLELPSGNPK